MSGKMENHTLYVKGMAASEMEDVWDDTVLRNAYDKAMNMAGEVVAKRVAMETNSSAATKSKSGKGKGKAKKEAPKPAEWKEGMPCRAVYEEDGLEYEAFLMSFIDDEECIVKFLGYENSETVLISTLKPTLGNEARMRQLEEASLERADDGFESQAASESVDLYSDEPSTPEPADNQTNKKKKSNKKKPRGQGSQFGELPSVPMPNMNMFRNMGADTPLPPPPPLLSLAGTDEEQQAISDMLLSWYMTGYYTGLYQGMKRQRQSRRY